MAERKPGFTAAAGFQKQKEKQRKTKIWPKRADEVLKIKSLTARCKSQKVDSLKSAGR